MIVIKNQALRSTLGVLLPFAVIPAVIILGAIFLEEKRHLVVSLGVTLLALLLFWSGFERSEMGSRRSVLLAVMVALCVLGRMIPLFKPVTAIVVIAAVYLGKEAGFACGALAALISNFMFAQGPWTPFQMLGWGIIGLFAGYLAHPLSKSRIALVIYGVISGLAFSMIMDVWSVIHYNGLFSFELYLLALLESLPHTAIYAASNVIFLLFMAKPFGDKLSRIKIKYGV
jgi:energy-coupling factor transport system substrate-specific component